MSKKKNKDTVKVFVAQMLPAALLREHDTNSNKQSKHAFAELRKNIRENGFDENIIVRPVEDGYEIVAGNHRFRAGRAEGMEEFPCVIRDDWGQVEAEIQSVRRNYVRGAIDKDAFTAQVNKLVKETGIFIGDLMERFGFEDPDKFAEYYKEEKKKEEKVAQATVSAPAVKMIDDLGLVLSAIYEKHGDTAPNSFIIFPAASKAHMMIASTPTLKRTLEQIAVRCIAEKMDINVALGGLLSIGMSVSDFNKNGEKAKEEGSKQYDSNSDLDIEIIKNGSR